MQFKIQHELKELERTLLRHERQVIPKAKQQATNRTIVAVQGHSVREIAKVTGYKQKDVRERMKLWRATSTREWAAIDAIEGRAHNLIRFVRPAQRTPQAFRARTRRGFKYKGVRASAWRKRREYRGTFIIRVKGNPIVMRRQSAARKPLAPVLGPSIRREFIRPALESARMAFARQRFRKELAQAISYNVRAMGRRK